MKKFIFSIITIIVLLLIILLFKIFAPNFLTSTSQYSNDDVANLILKGVENFDNMNNVSFEIQTDSSKSRHYYKGNKFKMLLLESFQPDSENILSAYIIDLDQKKQYSIRDSKKTLVVQTVNSINNGIQYTLAQHIENARNPNINYQYKYEYQYVKDESLEGKDCIFVKQIIYAFENGTYIDINTGHPEEEIYVYWIEKSTGFVLGISKMPSNMDSATPGVIIRNITFGEVVDSDFEINIPEDYTIIDMDELRKKN